VGRFDGCWGQGLAGWEMAARILMVEEAGGKVTGLDGGKVPLDGSLVIATNGSVHDQFGKVLAGAVG